jgi:phytoene dehydrogenase-like protein
VTSEHYDVIVVGAGYGGVTIAGLLARDGQRVLLVDKNNEPGGKGLTIRRHGHVYEMWGGLGVPANNSRFHELVAALGLEDEVKFVFAEGNSADLRYKAATGEWRSAVSGPNEAEDPNTVERMKTVFDATDEDFACLGKMFGDIVGTPDDELDALDDVGALEWMRSFGFRESLVTQMACTLNLLFCTPVNRIPVSEAVRTLRDIYAGGAGRYHVGGYGKVAEACAAYVEKHGGTFLPGTRVQQILVEDGRAVGIATSKAEFRAPVIISDAGIQPTVLKLVGTEHFPADYVERVRSLEPSFSVVGVRYFLDRPVFELPMTLVYSDRSWWDDERYAAAMNGLWPDVSLVFVGVPGLFDRSLIPESGEQVAISAALGPADPRSPMNEVAVAKSEETLRELWPELFEHIVRREPYHAQHVSNMTRDSVVPGQGGEAIGLGQVIGQCGRSKPDPRTPLPGLYLVGCDAGGHGAGTHQAVDSGFNVAAMVSEDLGIPTAI